MTNIAQLSEKLDRVANLPPGWDYGREGPAAPISYANAKSLLQSLHLMNVGAIDILPGRSGSITIAAIRSGDELEVSCRANGLFNFNFMSKNGIELEEDDLTLGGVLCLLREQGWQSIRSFGSCTHGVTVLSSNVIPVRPLKTLVMGPGFPSYAWIALPEPEQLFATTFEDSMMHAPAVSRQSSGEFRQFNFRREVA